MIAPTPFRLFAAVAALAIGVAVSNGAPDRLLVGSSDGVWLVTCEPDSSGKAAYHVARRGLEGGWESIWPGAVGKVTTAAAPAHQLVVFFDGSDYVRYFQDHPEGRPGMNPGENLLPPGGQYLAACAAVGAGDSFYVLAVRKKLPPVPATATSGAASSSVPAASSAAASVPAAALPVVASGPATSSGPTMRSASVEDQLTYVSGKELVVLRYAQQKWQQEALVDVPPAGVKSAAMVALPNELFLRLDLPDGQRLMRLAAGAWTDVALPDPQDGLSNLAILSISDSLMLVQYAHSGEVTLRPWTDRAWQPPVAVFQEKKPVLWPDKPPLVAGLGIRLALVWQEKDQWLFSTATLTGEMARPQTVEVEQSPGMEAAYQMEKMLLAVSLALTIILMFWPGQPMRTAPFSLPPGMPPANLARRGLAIFIDFFPFPMMAAVWQASSGVHVEPTLQNLFVVSPEMLYASVIMVIAYLIYCVLMEFLLGATLGKMAMHLKVVGDQGKKATMREIVLRNVTKIPEIQVLVISLLFPILTKNRQRVGDKIAWTAVVEARAVPVPPRQENIS